MTNFEDGLNKLEELFGNGRDNLIALATVDKDGLPSVRDVDAHYEDGVFYVITYSNTTKMKDIELNPTIAISAHNDSWFTARAKGENLGHVLAEKNSNIRAKLRETFKFWYDDANNENDENCVYLAITLLEGKVVSNHGRNRLKMDFLNKKGYVE